MLKIKKTKGFTLAEVLIVLGIIGILAEMTIPTLINETNKAEYVAALKKAYSSLNQAHKAIAADSGGDFAAALSDAGAADSVGVANLFIQKMKVVKNCGLTLGASECFPDGKGLDGITEANINQQRKNQGAANVNAFITTDGISYVIIQAFQNCEGNIGGTWYGLANSPLNRTCGFLFTDVNGPKKGPGRLGRDWFIFWMAKDGFYPFGMYEIQDNIDGTCIQPFKGPGYPGALCTMKVLTEGAMNY